MLSECRAVKQSLVDLRPQAARGELVMGEAELGWMSHCERLQEANAAMGLREFVQLLSFFSERSAEELLDARRDAAARMRTAHGLLQLSRTLNDLLTERFVAACPELRAAVDAALETVSAAVSAPASRRSLEMLREQDGGGEAAGLKTESRVEVDLSLLDDGSCSVQLKLSE